MITYGDAAIPHESSDFKLIGALGMGWRIDGLSSITMCPRTVALDGFVEPFDYANGLNNALCLDGKRLVQTESGSGYIEYRTLLDSFARIVYINHDSQRQTSFLVYTKDGQILTYGANPDATLVSSSGVHTWGISRIEDRHGNYIAVRYEPSDAGGVQSQDLTPGSVTYTGSVNEPGSREIRFSYEDRPDVLTGFRSGGAPFSKRRRLASIATYVRGEQLGRTYLLGYDPALSTLSQITSVTECSTTSAGSACKQPTTFTYRRDEGFDIKPDIGVKPGAWVDLNGDGRQDILHTDVIITDSYKPLREGLGGILEAAAYYAHPAAGAATTFIYRGYVERQIWPGPSARVSHSANFAQLDDNFPYDNFVVPVSGLQCQGLAPGFIFDFNGDKRDDVIEVCSRPVIDRVLPSPKHHIETNLQLALSRGDGTFEQAGTLFSLTNAKNFFTHDINGDGLEDILYCYGDLLAYRTRVAGGNFGPEQTTESYGTLCSRTPFRLQLDVDGNGTLELVVNKGNRTVEGDRELAALFAGADGPFWKPVGRTVDLPLSDAIRVGDFNGDGLADIIELPRAWIDFGGAPLAFSAKGAPIIWLNVGGRFEPRYPAGDADVEVKPGMFVTDFDHDGRSDILYESGDDFGGQPRMKRFSASLDAATSTALSNTPRWSPLGGDVNADGVLDLIVPAIQVDQKLMESFLRPMYTEFLDEYQQWLVLRGRGRTTNLLESVRDGLGKLTTVEYTSANVLDKTYTAGTSCDAREECVRRMPLLVSRHDERRGNESGHPQEHTAIYSYVDARIDRSGNGWLGFAQRTIKERDGAGNERTLVVDYGKRSERLMLAPGSNASYAYPYAGLATRYTLTSAAAAGELVQGGSVTRTSVTDVGWQMKQSASGRPFPYVNNRTTTVSDNGVPIATTHEQFEVDGYGNVTLNRTTQGADVTTTVNDFTPTPEQEASWLISLPKTEAVTSQRNGLSVTREQAFGYDALGFVTSHTRAPGSAGFEVVTTFTPDEFGNVAVVDVTAGGESRATAVGYDAEGIFPATVTNAKLQTTQLRFDEIHGGITVAADPNGIVTRRAYDGFGRLSVADGPAGQVAVDYFSTFPHPIAGPSGTGAWVASTFGMVVEAAGRRVETTFDLFGRPVSRSVSGYGGAMVSEELVYFGENVQRRTRRHLATEPFEAAWEYEYDAWNRLTTLRTPDGAEHRQDYSSAGALRPDLALWLPTGGVEVLRSTDPNQKQNVQILDRYGLPVRNIDGRNIATAAQTTDYTYGPFNQLREIRDNLRNSVIINYYTYGQVADQYDSNLGGRSYTYTPFDELKTVTDALNRTRTYSYDSLGRLESLVDDDGLTEWSYDGAGPNELGRLVAIHGPATAQSPGGHETRYTYESPTATANRGLLETVTQVLDGQELTTRVEYDEFARPRVTHYPAAAGQDVRVENTYTNGLLTRVDDISASRKVLWEILSTEHGYRIKDEARGDQTTTTYGYQPKTDRIASISAVRGTELVQNLTYQYNANGTVRERHDHLAASFPEVFGYDELNRLKERRQQQSAGADLVDTFEYDAIGNLTQMPGVGTYTFEPTRPQLVASAGSHQYHHDANGNLDSRSGPSVPGGSQTLTYNAFDMPKRITPAASSAVPDVDLEYDGFQNRAVKRATDVCSEAPCPSTTTYYAGGGYTQTRRVEGATTDVEHRYRVFAGGAAIAELVRDGAGASVATWYPHTDALGSPNVLLDEAGTRLGQTFAPFGQATPDVPVGDSGSQMGFTGHDHDAEVGLIDMNGRVYDPTLGRFLTADPYVQAPFWSQGLNRYAYVFNSPLNYTDPSGFSAIDDYFQGLNDAPPEQAIPGYIGTALVAGLAAYTAYEAVSATISTSASNAAATSIAESGGADAPAAGAPAAAYVAMQRFSKAMGPTTRTVPGKPPTRALTAPTGGGQQSATVQNRGLREGAHVARYSNEDPVVCNQPGSPRCGDAGERGGPAYREHRRLDEQARSFFRMVADRTVRLRREFGAEVIHNWKTNTYRRSETAVGPADGGEVTTKFEYNPESEMDIANLHTHPPGNGSQYFSAEDIELGRNESIWVYALKPGGKEMLVYDPGEDSITTVPGIR